MCKKAKPLGETPEVFDPGPGKVVLKVSFVTSPESFPCYSYTCLQGLSL